MTTVFKAQKKAGTLIAFIFLGHVSLRLQGALSRPGEVVIISPANKFAFFFLVCNKFFFWDLDCPRHSYHLRFLYIWVVSTLLQKIAAAQAFRHNILRALKYIYWIISHILLTAYDLLSLIIYLFLKFCKTTFILWWLNKLFLRSLLYLSKA